MADQTTVTTTGEDDPSAALGAGLAAGALSAGAAAEAGQARQEAAGALAEAQAAREEAARAAALAAAAGAGLSRDEAEALVEARLARFRAETAADEALKRALEPPPAPSKPKASEASDQEPRDAPPKSLQKRKSLRERWTQT